MHLELSQKEQFKKIKEATVDSISNKIVDENMNASITSPQNSLQTAKNEHDKKRPRKKDKSPEEKPKIVDNLRLIQQYKDKFVRQ